jgi:hypothetical protein
VQEPLGYLEIDDIESQREYPHNCRNVNLWHEGGEGMAAIYTTPPAQPAPVQEPVAWREFDGEGGYTYFAYQDNETWRDEYIKRNGEKYADWVEPLYTTPTAQPAPVQEPSFSEGWERRCSTGGC